MAIVGLSYMSLINDCITHVNPLSNDENSSTARAAKSRTPRAVVPRQQRWPWTLSDSEFAALCSKLNMAAFDDAIRQDVARALQEGGDYECTA
jgi:hypothetical protein